MRSIMASSFNSTSTVTSIISRSHMFSWTRALVLTAFVLPFHSSYAIWPLPAKKFSGNSMLNAGSLGITAGDRVVAFGDFNGDQLCAKFPCSYNGSMLMS
jgi:hypothetical protein